MSNVYKATPFLIVYKSVVTAVTPSSDVTDVALHYKLAMEDKEANDPHGQIVYTPLLDPNRDEKILNVLPDYMTDEIMFAREQGTPYYPKTNDSEYVLLAT
jgi:hypothetical protein